MRGNTLKPLDMAQILYLVAMWTVVLFLSITAAQAGQVNLAWNASAGATGYQVHYGTASGSYTNNANAGNTTTYTVANLADGATYYFAVKAYDGAGNQSGFSNEVSKTLAAVAPAPVANFSATPTSGAAPLAVQFSNSSTNATSWSWNFGDGTTSTAQNPAKTYSSAGSYTVSLTATGTGGSHTATKTGYITVNPPAPVASFTASPASGTAPLLVTFSCTSTGSITSRSWDFGDGTASTAQNAVKTYESAGTYTAKLTVTGPGGSNTTTKTISATTTAPVANFSATPTSGTAPLTVNFHNSSTGDIKSWAWSFGDGGTSTAQNPAYTYAKAGTYDVTLTATTATGSKVTKTLKGYITADPASGTPTACASPSSIWPSDAVPAVAAKSDPNGVELGVKFKSAVDGYLCGVRFYKGSANTGTHVGSLWSNDGQLLARATFTNETASGWQQVDFAQPVAVKANTVYVASYYAPNGRYAIDESYFATTGVVNGPLSALRNGESGGNGVYLYGGGFPSNTWGSSNYWVDVVFSTGAASWLEAGEVSVGGAWQRVTFAKPFKDPVVVANPLNFDAAEPGVIRIRNVNATGFEIRSQTWDYLGGSPVVGKVGYLAMERGTHTLDNGVQVEAGRIDTNLTSGFGKVTFAKSFSTAPVVVTGVASTNDASAVVTRVRNVAGASFEVRMQKEEAKPQAHATETIAYIAWQPSAGTVEGLDFQVGRTSSIVTHNFYALAYPKATATLPVLLADMQTTSNSDTANLRWRNKTLSSVEVKVAEEQSKDLETTHGREVVGYILLAPKP